MSEVFYAAIKQLFPGVEREYKFHPTRRWRFDYAWREKNIALEVEGGVWTQGRHIRGSGFMGDLEKYNAAGLLGWRVFRITPQMIKSGEALNLLEEVFENQLKSQRKA